MTKKNKRPSQLNRLSQKEITNNRRALQNLVAQAVSSTHMVPESVRNLIDEMQPTTTPKEEEQKTYVHDPRCPQHLRSKLGTHWIPTKILQIDRYDDINKGYQRPPKIKPKDIEGELFSESSCQVLDVALRADGTYWVVDGQQRTIRATLATPPRTVIECRVLFSSGREEEAARYVSINDKRKRMTPVEVWIGSAVAQDSETLEIEKVLEKYDLHVRGHKSIKCITTIKTIVKQTGTKTLDKILTTIRDSWPDTAPTKKYTEQIVKALGLIYGSHPTIGTDHITQKLSKKSLEMLTQKANIMHIQQGGAASVKHKYLTRVFLDQINLRSKNKLAIYETPIQTVKPPKPEEE